MLNKILNTQILLIWQRSYQFLSFPRTQKGSTGRRTLRSTRFPHLSFRALNKKVIKTVKALVCWRQVGISDVRASITPKVAEYRP